MLASRRPTFADRIAQTGGYTSGFDYLRLGLAIAVLFGHSFLVVGDKTSSSQLLPFGLNSIRGYGILPVFFALSGFLVAASLVRNPSLRTFMTLRGLRILPALLVEITLSALLLGPVFSTLRASEYFAGPEFYRYFLNAVGYIHYQLPGVFTANPVSGIVNASLWTVPYEAECYIVLCALAFVGLTRHAKYFLPIIVGLCALGLAYVLLKGDTDVGRGTATGRQLILFFLAGVGLYLIRNSLPYSGFIAGVCAVIAAVTITSHTWIYIAPLPVAYLTAYVGLLQPRKLPIIFTGDYSYGVYLYAYPIQQAIYQSFANSRVWYLNFVLSLACVSLFAAFSWHAVEKPVLRLKRWLLAGQKRAHSSSQMASPDKTKPSVAEGGSDHKLEDAQP